MTKCDLSEGHPLGSSQYHNLILDTVMNLQNSDFTTLCLLTYQQHTAEKIQQCMDSSQGYIITNLELTFSLRYLTLSCLYIVIEYFICEDLDS